MSSKKYKRSYNRLRKFKTNKRARCVLIISAAAAFILICCVIITAILTSDTKVKKSVELPDIHFQQKLIKVNKYSRPGIKLRKVNAIVVHYTANPGTNALDNRNYFNNLPTLNKGRTKEQSVYASSHFVIGLAGEIVQCIPLNEMAYASNDRNSDSIAIECCHKDKSGEFTKATYDSVLDLVSYLCLKYNLDEKDVIRHYDITGKICPKYFVDNKEEWDKFRTKIKNRINQYRK